MRLTVGTFNIRNLNDRYDERRPLLAAAFAAFAPDVAALQEVSFDDQRQDDMLAAAVPLHTYRGFIARSPRHPAFGNAILVRTGDAMGQQELRLEPGRAAHRVLLLLEGQITVWVVNTHLHHRREEPAVRAAQAQALARWMEDAPAADATVIAGDFNAPPEEPACQVMRTSGYRSAFAEANGTEPAFTWPSGESPTMDTDGDPACVDYLWIRGRVAAVRAWLACNEPSATDATLFPSDHFAVAAELEIG
ncbi:MAG TPA: endonuclease/exonuclease/phosphatase family protein [Tepidiformaceae bacterium]|nr:endonuclease/exonuclease/phosphatase family protein [Tepidiformaceae bacterium]